ncbi:MAG: hypothetical protein JSW65_06460 [Candidatus Bipolaricaulota bacterium]|nr:MAG: hypothetical protein JSW65_06460 [Candidatus Bipolaricaulota bacterium]
MDRVWRALVRMVVVVSIAAAIIVPAVATPIHVPGGPRFDGGGSIVVPLDVPDGDAEALFTPIHVPGGP